MADPPPAADRATSQRRRPSRPTVAVATLAAVLIAVLGWQLADARAAASDRQERAEAATDFALALLAYDHADLDAAVRAVEAVSTPGFAEDHRDRFVGDLADELRDRRAVAVAEVAEVFLATDPADVHAREVERTRALVGAQVEVTTDGERRTSTPTLELVLVRTDDGWRVDDAGSTGRAGLATD